MQIEQNKGGNKMFKKSLMICLGAVFLFTLTGEAFSGWWDKNSTTKENKVESKKQIIIHSYDNYKHTAFNAMSCSSKCNKLDQPISDYLAKGWRVVTSTPHEISVSVSLDIVNYHRNLDSYTEDQYKQCICVGKEYVIER